MSEPLNRRNFLKTVGLAAGALAVSQIPLLAATGARKPNIVFILADDMGWSQSGCYGSKYYETPNIDRLAKQGMRFTDAYAACPVCSPTRASIMTGKYPARLHLTDYIPGKEFPSAKYKIPDWQKFLPLEEVTIAEELKVAGYVTASFGKWHLSITKKPPKSEAYNPDKQGFDETIITYKPKRNSNPENDAHNVRKIAERSLKFLEENRDKAFFLFVSHNSIHGPEMERSALVEKYRQKEGSDLPQNNPVLGAMIETLDNSVGQILQKLDDLNLAENTIVIFYSDNGGLRQTAEQTPLRGGKATVYEGGIREPLIVRWPGVVKAGSICHDPVISVDFLPTLNEMAGIRQNSSPDIDGMSIVSLLRDARHVKREALYWHYPHYHSSGIAPSGAVRKGNFKLIEWFDTSVPEVKKQFELYNLKDDPGEKNDLSDELPEKVEELSKLLRKWRKSVGAQLMTPNPDYDPAKATES